MRHGPTQPIRSGTKLIGTRQQAEQAARQREPMACPRCGGTGRNPAAGCAGYHDCPGCGGEGYLRRGLSCRRY